ESRQVRPGSQHAGIDDPCRAARVDQPVDLGGRLDAELPVEKTELGFELATAPLEGGGSLQAAQLVEEQADRDRETEQAGDPGVVRHRVRAIAQQSEETRTRGERQETEQLGAKVDDGLVALAQLLVGHPDVLGWRMLARGHASSARAY